jgi:hypothetical protein
MLLPLLSLHAYVILQVPQHALTVAGAVILGALWCLFMRMRRRRLQLFGRRRSAAAATAASRRFSP